MMQAIRKRIDDDKGFTLIELMVVVLIIAILIAIAIPTFLGLRERAQNRAAQSDLRNGLTAAKAYFTDGDTYDGFTGLDDGEAIEPSLTWNDDVAASEGAVTVRLAAGNDLVLTTVSASEQAFCIADSATAGTNRGDEDVATVAGCGPTDW